MINQFEEMWNSGTKFATKGKGQRQKVLAPKIYRQKI
jgi:hypothetical protein